MGAGRYLFGDVTAKDPTATPSRHAHCLPCCHAHCHSPLSHPVASEPSCPARFGTPWSWERLALESLPLAPVLLLVWGAHLAGSRKGRKGGGSWGGTVGHRPHFTVNPTPEVARSVSLSVTEKIRAESTRLTCHKTWQWGRQAARPGPVLTQGSALRPQERGPLPTTDAHRRCLQVLAPDGLVAAEDHGLSVQSP